MEVDYKFLRLEELKLKLEQLKVELKTGRLRFQAVRARFVAVREISEGAKYKRSLEEINYGQMFFGIGFFHKRVRLRTRVKVLETMQKSVKGREEYLDEAEMLFEESRRKLDQALGMLKEAEAPLVFEFAKHNANEPDIVEKIMMKLKDFVGEKQLEFEKRRKDADKARLRLCVGRQGLARCMETERQIRKCRHRTKREKLVYQQLLSAWREARVSAARNVKRIQNEITRMEMEVNRHCLW